MKDAGKLYTYQEVAGIFAVHEKTVARWFRERDVFRPTSGTVRISQTQLDDFIADSGRRLPRRDPPRRTRNPRKKK
jgi:hypothetical protein